MAFLWDAPPRIIGHRGSPRLAPENTLAGFRAALAEGARALELDARLTADEEVVVHHDAYLGRTAPGEGHLEEHTWAQLSALDAGAWHSPRFAGEPIPRLVDVLAQLPAHVLLNVEIKPDALNAGDAPRRVAEIVEDAGALDRVLVTSFDPELADDYAQRVARPAGYLMPFAPEPADLEAWPRLAFLALAQDALVEEALAEARGRDRRIIAWTLNDAEGAARAYALGVSAVITDRPGFLLAHLGGGAPAGSPPPASAP